MTNFRITFEHPWVLLLLIPAVVLTMLPYLRMNKRYRKTRNRITSIVLHLTVMALCILVLAGIQFDYQVPNTKSEVLLVVDTSYSTQENAEDRDAFIKTVMNAAGSEFQLGVVTFGSDPVYAVEMTENTSKNYEQYQRSLQKKAEYEASDIASALEYASNLFSYPESARIVLISDGVQTDRDAMTVIRSIAARGIKVDTVCFPNAEAENEVQLLGMTAPDRSIRTEETVSLELTLESRFDTPKTVKIRMCDNGKEAAVQDVALTGGVQKVVFNTQFAEEGMHELSFEIVDSDCTDSPLNNILNSYIYLEVFDKVLIIESIDDESSHLQEMLGEEMKVSVMNIHDSSFETVTLEQLRAYDEVILCNISNQDMPEGFDEILHSYVYDIGGGLLTVGGNTADSVEGDWHANAYNKEDMYGTLYQQMLPVEIIDYTPPTAVVIIIDRSSSMYDGDEWYQKSKLYFAKQGAEACLDVLSDRDYVGIMSLSDSYDEELELTPRPERAKILEAIDAVQKGNGTIYEGALRSARQALLANTDVEKRHIILVSDGQPGDADAEKYLDEARINAKAGITMSVVGVECHTKGLMLDLVKAAGGDETNYYDIKDLLTLATQMRNDLMAPEIKEVNYTKYVPTIENHSSITVDIQQTNIPTLSGFYGSKLKDGATEILGAEYAPLYAEWEYGKGRVGSFMCDLNGTWSGSFVVNATGARLMQNIVQSLFPTESVRYTDIQLELSEDNFQNVLSVITPMEKGQSILVSVTGPDSVTNTYTPADGSGQTRVNFRIKTPGLHRIFVEKKNENGSVVSSKTIYKSFSYSQEYNEFTDSTACTQLMANLANDGAGVVISNDDPLAVIENASKNLDRNIDPRIVFLLIALILFLTDIAIRKFKFKWPHELIREHKEKKAKQGR